jgi:hypothetical protein
MTAYEDAIELVNHASDELTKIRFAYEQGLSAKSVSPAMLISIKNLIDNLRSSLDFVSVAAHEKFCSGDTAELKPSFPYAKTTTTQQEYRELLSKRFAGLDVSCPDLFQGLIDVQHFGAKGFTWLPVFIELNNESKHQRLIPQIRRKQLKLQISDGSTGIVVEEGAAIILGTSATVSVGAALINGDQTASTDSIPNMQGGKAEIITWVSFYFESNNQPVLPLLTKATAGVKEIVELFCKGLDYSF